MDEWVVGRCMYTVIISVWKLGLLIIITSHSEHSKWSRFKTQGDS
jgi:hypothetical protein